MRCCSSHLILRPFGSQQKSLTSIRRFIFSIKIVRTGKNVVRTNLTEKMNCQKICSRFVSNFFSDGQKQMRFSCSRDFIETAYSDRNCLKTIVTGDES